MDGERRQTDAASARRMALIQIIPRRVGLVDLGVVAFVLCLLYGLVRVGAEWSAPLESTVEIDLSLSALPRYTFFSLCRGFAAFGLSFVFTLAYGYVAARVRRADRIMLPALDILQSIPVLGFMPGVVLALAALFPRTNVGLELAAVVMIFTGQVWNMTFSFYHSLRAIPPDLMEASQVYRFDWWRRFTRVELPYSTVGLVWNGMMSMAGGWFFLTINEAFQLGSRDFRLPGVGAYMSVAIDRGDKGAMTAAVLAMIIMIVVVDQLFWRPLVAWSARFKFEDQSASTAAGSWVLSLLRRSRLYLWWRERRDERRARVDGSTPRPRRAPRQPLPKQLTRAISIVVSVASLIVFSWGAFKLITLLLTLDGRTWWTIGRASSYTLGRTMLAVAIGSLWTIPAGIYIGTHPRASEILQPIVQIAASFPAPMLFPLVLLLLGKFSISLSLGAIVLMILGTQWYILFNVIAGAMSIPQELHEAADVYRFTRLQRWKRLYLPGVFPHLVTGWVTAAGGAWNASIVSEYVHAGGTVRQTDGLGSLISTAAAGGQFPLLAAGVLTMAALVVTINRTFWKRLYFIAESRFTLSR
jgi:NitT/TauT family transport system permease protein